MRFCVCLCSRRKVKGRAGSRCSWCWRRKTCCCLTVCHAWENTGSPQHTPTLCSPHGIHTPTPTTTQAYCSFIQKQSQHTLLLNTCLCTNACKHTFACQLAEMTIGNWNAQLQSSSASWKEAVKTHFKCPLEQQLLLQGKDSRSNFIWTVAQISLQSW